MQYSHYSWKWIKFICKNVFSSFIFKPLLKLNFIISFKQIYIRLIFLRKFYLNINDAVKLIFSQTLVCKLTNNSKFIFECMQIRRSEKVRRDGTTCKNGTSKGRTLVPIARSLGSSWWECKSQSHSWQNSWWYHVVCLF